MTIKFTYEKVKSEIEDGGEYFLLSETYVDRQEPLEIIDRYGYRYNTSFANFKIQKKRKNRMYEFAKYNPFSTENVKLYIKIKNIPIELIDGKYISNENRNLTFKCSLCGKIFISSFSKIQGRSNPCLCLTKWRILDDANSLNVNFPKISKEWDYEVNKGSPENYSFGAKYLAGWICSICGYRWLSKISNRTSFMGRGCPRCSSSKGERKVEEFLSEHGFKYIKEHVFAGCVNKRHLRFDFYLPHLNLCIEYDGILHFKNKFNKIDEFNETKARDKIKTRYCLENGITLLRIPYTDFEKIDQILFSALCEKRRKGD